MSSARKTSTRVARASSNRTARTTANKPAQKARKNAATKPANKKVSRNNIDTSIDWAELCAHAASAQQQAYAPYSRFHVGAALLTQEGHVFAGCNVENASYGLCLCAERNAVAQAVAFGHRKFAAMVVIGGKEQPATPCGMCRQVLFEFAPNMPVLCVTRATQRGTTLTVKELLPYGFGPADLGLASRRAPTSLR